MASETRRETNSSGEVTIRESGSDEWAEQRSLQDEIGRSLDRPVIIDWCDYIFKCYCCGHHNAAFSHHAILLENGEGWIMCAQCQNDTFIQQHHKVRR